MNTELISSKAKWTLQELIPIILALGVGGLGILFGITNYFTLTGAVITSAVGFGLAVWALSVSIKRKNKSTLFASLTNNNDFTISVWMRKPIKDKWNGKLDLGKNKGNLIDVEQVSILSVRGTRVVQFNLKDGQKLYIPHRLVQETKVRNYISKALSVLGGVVAFENKEHGKEFKALLTGEKYVIPDRELNSWEKPDTKSSTKPVSKAATVPQTPLTEATPASESSTGEEQVSGAKPQDNVSDKVVEPSKKLGYGAYRKVDPLQKVAEATAEIGEDKDSGEEINLTASDLLNDSGRKTTSVAFNFETGKEGK